MHILGIETSCDETAAAVVSGEGHVLSDVVHSQIDLHQKFGGIVPEVASRDHLRAIDQVVTRALEASGVGMHTIDGIAVTCQPGLTGALWVGVKYAEGLSIALRKPLIGVDHLVGHLVAPFLRYPGQPEHAAPPLPYVGLLASGGHTALYLVKGFDIAEMTELGATRDDAAGEAFDKVAKLLGLGYPGGPIIDKLAAKGDPTRVELRGPMPKKASLEFSFSGLKAQVARFVARQEATIDGPLLYDLCAAFQATVVTTLVSKTVAAALREGVSAIVLSGGVAANRGLRQVAQAEAEKHGLSLFVPPLAACTDNAAMIALAGAPGLARGENHTGRLRVSPRTSLLRVTRKGAGKRE